MNTDQEVIMDLTTVMDLLGDKITALVLGIDSTDILLNYIFGGLMIPDNIENCLPKIVKVCKIISFPYGSDTLRAWMFGTNSCLEGRSPALSIRRKVLSNDNAGLDEIIGSSLALLNR